MFAEIEQFYRNVRNEVESKFDADKKVLVNDIKVAVADTKVVALQEVAALAPDVQAAVQKAINELEQAVLAAITAHLL